MIDMLTPRNDMLLITKPTPLLSGDTHKVGDGTLWAPAQSDRTRHEYGVKATVIKCGPSCTTVSPGDTIITTEFDGVPLFDGKTETPYWLISEANVLAVVEA